MKILENGIVREMNEKEIEQFFGAKGETPATETELKAMAYDILMGVTE